MTAATQERPAALADLIASARRTSHLLLSACLVIPDPIARRIAMEAVREAEEAIAAMEAAK